MDQSVDLDVEGLFNEEPSLDQEGLDDILPGPDHAVLHNPGIAPPPPAVLERFLDLVYSGGSRKAAWGRQGHITTIEESTVNLQCMRIVAGTSQWKLSTPHRLDHVFDRATILAWSPTGVDLAVVDVRGQVTFFTMTTACLNRLSEVKHNIIIPTEEQGQPVLAFWLNQDRPDRPPRSIVLNITNRNGQWVQNIGRAKSFLPQLNRALLIINKKGIISLTYQSPAGQYQRVSLPISAVQSALCTHGAVAATTEGKLIVALYDTHKRLSVYRVQIDWPAGWRTNASDPAQPLLSIEILDVDIPMSNIGLDSMEINLDQTYMAEGYTLTHLEILPTSDIENSLQLPPQIWAAFTLMNQSLRPTDPGFLQSSVIKRWSVIHSEIKLHPKFEEMASKTEGQKQQHQNFSIENLPDTHFPQPIINLELVEGGQHIAIATIDGQLELWNPFTMNLASMETHTNEVTSMAQSGFSIGPLLSATSIALSPNTSTSINLLADGKHSINQALYLNQPLQALDLNDPSQSAAVSSLVLALARACFSNSGADDVLSCISLAIPHEQQPDLLKRMYSVLFKPTEFIHEKAPSSQLDRVINKPLVQKVLSFHMSLYSSVSKMPLQANGFPHPTTWSRLWAWIMLNVRHVTNMFSHLFKEIQQSNSAPQPTLLAPSYLELISNLIKYVFDIYRYIFETILEVGDRQTNPDMFDEPAVAPYFNLGDERGDGSQGLVALLLNINWSRNALLSPVRAMHIFVDKADMPNPNIRYVVDAIRRYSFARGLSLAAVEHLLNSNWYVRVGLADNEQYDPSVVTERQIEMMATGVVGQHYQNTIKNLLKNAINGEQGIRKKGSQEMSRLKLFTDTPQIPWLLLNMESCIPPKSLESVSFDKLPMRERKEPVYDVHKKTPITIGKQADTKRDGSTSVTEALSNGFPTTENESPQMIRRCTRCGSVSEELQGIKWDWPKNLVTYYARCVCDGFWILEPLDDREIPENDNKSQAKVMGNDVLKLTADEIKQLQ